jgi:transcription termination factor Rho
LSDPTNDAGEPAEKRVRKTRVAKTAAPKDSLTIPPLEAASAAPPAAPAATPAVAPPSAPSPPPPPRQQAPAPATASHATHETPAPSATATGSTVPRPHPQVPEGFPTVFAGDLKRMPAHKLLEIAEQLQISEGVARARKQDIIFALLKVLTRHGEGVAADGVLEILPDGFGFLRAAEASYLAGPDDTYISPSQIRRFNLRTGDHISGPHPLAEGRRALLRAEHRRHHQRRAAGSVEEQGAVREPDPAVPAQAASSWNAATARAKTSPAASST